MPGIPLGLLTTFRPCTPVFGLTVLRIDEPLATLANLAIAQFGAGGRLVDSFGGVGIDGGRVGIFATVATNCDGLHVTVEDNDAVALGLRWQTERCAGGAADQQQTGQTSLESPHGIDSFFGGLALVQRCEVGQSRCRAEF